jgi:plastocyanin
MRRGKLIVWLSVVAALALAASGCSSDEADGLAANADGSTIAVRDYVFEPGALTVSIGETVTWVWEGQAAHNVIGEGFGSDDQSSGTFRYTFEQPGTYAYTCTIHPGMEGEVIVAESP